MLPTETIQLAMLQGRVTGIIETLQYQNSQITKKEVAENIRAILSANKATKEEIEYFIFYWGLEESSPFYNLLETRCWVGECPQHPYQR